MKKEAKQTNMWKQNQNNQQPKIRVSGQWLAHARISLRTQARLCVCKFLPKNRAEPQNGNSNNLTYILNIQIYKPKLDKHVKAYYNKETRQTERFKGRKRKKGKRKV